MFQSCNAVAARQSLFPNLLKSGFWWDLKHYIPLRPSSEVCRLDIAPDFVTPGSSAIMTSSNKGLDRSTNMTCFKDDVTVQR